MTSFFRLLSRVSFPLALAALVPAITAAQAQTTGSCQLATGNIAGIFTFAICVIDVLIVPLVFAIAFIVFIIGIYRYFIAGAANEEKRQEGQKFILWGLIGFVLMFSVWGIINVLVTSLGFGGKTRPALPVFLEANRNQNNQSQVLPAGEQRTDGQPYDATP